MADAKALKSLNQRIGALQTNLGIASGRIAATPTRKAQLSKTAGSNRKKLNELEKQRNALNKRIANRNKRMARGSSGGNEDIPF